ncbi:hypothetical protein [Nonomuraea sp. B1E8]|uniref:hypothetical protein n=1 Tax=unclassified Nonomuraea TaxID=2593643 RepID=UPI00325E9A7F
MGRDDSRDAVLARTEHVWPEVYNALTNGIKTAIYLHEVAEWEFRDDKHLYQHMIRRKAIEAFKSLAPEGDTASDQSDATDLPMSGLILALEQDIVRIWHIATADIPKPTTPAKLEFVDQPASGQASLFDPHEFSGRPRRRNSELNHLILRWTVKDHEIERYELIRPAGIWKGRVDIDWRKDLLPRFRQPPAERGSQGRA